jgi:predicted porin
VYAAGFATDYAAGGEGRIDSGIWYVSPNFNGVTVSGSYSPKTVATTTGFSGNSLSLNATYANGPLVVGLGNEENRAGDTITQLYGNYDLGVAKLYASYATIKGGSAADRAGITFAAAASAVPNGGASSQVAADGEINNWTIGATIPMGAMSIRAGYSQWNGNGAAGQKDDNKLGLGVKYDLSKRTYIYSDVASQTRKNNVATSSPATSNSKITSFDLGVAHSF